jgi:hypothetical protein
MNMTKTENVFANRILDMMEDNSCTMKEALEWDFEAFDFDIRGMGADLLKDEFNFYLAKNGVYNRGIVEFYTDVMCHKTQDFALRKVSAK